MVIKLFIGTSIAPALAEQIALRAAPLAGMEGWRWSPKQQWHVTTLFIGQRDEADVQVISAAIERACTQYGPITLHTGQLLAMPEDRPGMLWVRFTPSEDLSILHHALASATSTPPSPHQPYVPHITLARGKSTPPIEGTPVVVPYLTLRQLTLFRSDPGPARTTHTPLGTWPFAAANA